MEILLYGEEGLDKGPFSEHTDSSRPVFLIFTTEGKRPRGSRGHDRGDRRSWGVERNDPGRIRQAKRGLVGECCKPPSRSSRGGLHRPAFGWLGFFPPTCIPQPFE